MADFTDGLGGILGGGYGWSASPWMQQANALGSAVSGFTAPFSGILGAFNTPGMQGFASALMGMDPRNRGIAQLMQQQQQRQRQQQQQGYAGGYPQDQQNQQDQQPPPRQQQPPWWMNPYMQGGGILGSPFGQQQLTFQWPSMAMANPMAQGGGGY